jgi:phosphoglycolate phosphatase-like HAD superfamily hydrolase
VVHYFSDVRGATGSFADYNKEKVLQELMAAHKLEGGQVLVVGDGPVEIKVAAAHACVALGVACDESQGECWDPAKRERLVAAGADLLVPDFSRAGVLEGYLFNE